MSDVNFLAHLHAHHRHVAMQNRAAAFDVGEPGRSGADFVAAFDADGDGALSAAEVEDSRLSRAVNEDNWSKVDADGDGHLTAAEIDARHAEVMQARAERMATIRTIPVPSIDV